MGDGYGDPFNGPGVCANADGTYTLSGIRFNDQFVVTAGGSCGFDHRYAREWWPEGGSNADVEYLTLTLEDPDRTGIDFTLEVGGTVTGRITDAATGDPIPGMNVTTGPLWLGTCTDDEGYYTLDLVPASYPFEIGAASGPNFCQNGAPHPYSEEVWQEGTATPITVASGATLPNINFTLSLFLPEPTDFVAEAAGKTQIDLTWADNASDKTGYQLERLNDDTWVPVATLPADTISYADTTVSCGTTFVYRLYGYRQGANDGDNVNSYYTWAEATTDPCAVELLLPENGSVFKTRSPEMTWAAVTDARRYRIEVGDAASFDEPLISQNVTETSFIPAEPLTPGTYFWHVQVQLDGSDVWSEWSATWSFTVDRTKPAPPVLQLPANGATLTVQPGFEWSVITDAVEYKLQIATDAEFIEPLVDVTITDAFYTPDADLADGFYYWRVKATDEAGNNSAWSETWTVRVDVVPVVAPDLITPADGERMRSRKPVFTWSEPGDAKRYQIQIDNDADFSSPLFSVKLKSATFTPETNIPAGDTYVWRVRTQARDGLWSEYSEPFAFEIDRTGPAAPTLLTPAPKEILATTTPTFDWEDLPDADLAGYVIQIDNNKDFSSPLVSETVTGSTYTATTPLSNRKYYWRVRGLDDVGNKGEWSGGNKFYVEVLRRVAQ